MKKPFSILAIAILIAAQVALPVSRVNVYADDTAPTDPAPATAAADSSASDSTSSSPSSNDQSAAPSADTTPPTVAASSSASSDSEMNSATDTPPGPPAGGGPIDAPDASSTPPATVPAGSSAGSDLAATTTPDTTSQATTTSDVSDIASTTAAISNTATTTSTSVSTASTGNNIASSTNASSTSAIVTGDAVATANITNIINVNMFDSDALVALLNNLSAGNNSINLDSSAFGHDGSIGCSGCSVQVSTTTGAAPSSIAVSATNTASIDNTTIVRASTGANSISGGSGIISTGNAYAAGNVATLANATLVNSRYVMLVLNSFGTWGGDLVLPTSSFWDNFLNLASAMTENPPAVPDSANVSVANSAAISTNASTSADTGGNMASSTDNGSVIQTGSAQSVSNSLNDVNQTHVGGATVDIIFHIFGNWSGQAFNLPPGFTALQTPDGLEIVASTASQSTVSQGALALSNANNASIQNNLDVSASTGGNTASGSGGAISTGSAYAASNSITAANVTSISHNWLAAIVNVFGDWNGNVSFGQPDLWVGIRADEPDGAAGPGNRVVYHYTIRNNGDAPAHDVVLSREFGSGALDPDPANPAGVWNVGTLAAGETHEIDETATVSQGTMGTGEQSVSNQAQVTETETDANNQDNNDVISLVVGPHFITGGGGTPGQMPDFDVTKTSDAASAIAASSTVGYTIHLYNKGGQASHALVTDQIRDPNGAVIHSENWDLGVVKAHEDITLTYEAFFSASSTPGVYSNSAQVISGDTQAFDSNIASTSVTISATGPGGLGLVVSSTGSGSSFGLSSSGSRFLTEATSTVRKPLDLSFLGNSAPLPPDAGGPLSGNDHSLLASVGNAVSTPYAWSLYLLVLAAGGWYLVYKRKEFGWGVAGQKK